MDSSNISQRSKAKQMNNNLSGSESEDELLADQQSQSIKNSLDSSYVGMQKVQQKETLEKDKEKQQPWVNIVDDVYDKINGRNIFAPYFALFLGVCCYGTELALALPFLIMMPDLKWSYDEGFTWTKWDDDQACSNRIPVQYSYDKDSIDTVDNWMTNFDMVWDSNLKIALFGSLYFTGFVIGSIFIIPLGDIYGRRPVIMLTSLISIPVNICLIFAHTHVLVYILLVIIGTMSIVRTNIGYMYMLEVIPESKRIKYHSIVNLSAVFFDISLIPLFIFIENGLLVFIVFTATWLLSFIWICFMPESPKFLHSHQKYKETHDALNTIAKINKTEPSKLKFREELNDDYSNLVSDNAPKVGFFDAFKNHTYRRNLIILAINWSACNLSYHIIGFFMEDFHGEIYINMFVMQIAELISFATASLYYKYVGINAGFIFANILMFGFSLLYTIWGHFEAMGYIWVFLMRLGASVCIGLSFFSTSEVFDVTVAARSFAICNIIARIVTISAPFITEMISFPIIVITLMSLLSGVVSYFIVNENPNKYLGEFKFKEA